MIQNVNGFGKFEAIPSHLSKISLTNFFFPPEFTGIHQKDRVILELYAINKKTNVVTKQLIDLQNSTIIMRNFNISLSISDNLRK